MVHQFPFGPCLLLPSHLSSQSRCLLGHIPICCRRIHLRNTPERFVLDPRVLSAVSCFRPSTIHHWSSFSPMGPTRGGVRPLVGSLVGRLFRAGTWPWILGISGISHKNSTSHRSQQQASRSLERPTSLRVSPHRPYPLICFNQLTLIPCYGQPFSPCRPGAVCTALCHLPTSLLFSAR